ncbi:hypothetical protein, partial [Burkholderia vietnamiensis]|uniref:hypothetical protein n=1 Tax=Burkholderia vietnamiensis TaxID=60552 RepID=UPI0012D9B589
MPRIGVPRIGFVGVPRIRSDGLTAAQRRGAAVCVSPGHRRASPIDPLTSTQEHNMTDVVIVSAARTAVGKFGGSLAKVAA